MAQQQLDRELRTSSLIGTVLNTLNDQATRAATRELIAPLIQRSPAPQALKDAALTVPPQGVHPDEVDGFPADEVVKTMAQFLDAGTVRLNARGAYMNVRLAEPTVGDALRNAEDILSEAGWSPEHAEPILAVFRDNGGKGTK